MPPAHAPDTQSTAPPHLAPSTHFLHKGPPQSTSLSAAFFLPSAHVAAAEQTPLTHELSAQSLSSWQVLPTAQGKHAAPPQSTSVSKSSFLPLLQGVGSWQILFKQIALLQSVPNEQTSPGLQPVHCAPPQSVSVSLPFLMPSVHPAATALSTRESGAGAVESATLPASEIAESASAIGEVESSFVQHLFTSFAVQVSLRRPTTSVLGRTCGDCTSISKKKRPRQR